MLRDLFQYVVVLKSRDETLIKTTPAYMKVVMDVVVTLALSDNSIDSIH